MHAEQFKMVNVENNEELVSVGSFYNLTLMRPRQTGPKSHSIRHLSQISR